MVDCWYLCIGGGNSVVCKVVERARMVEKLRHLISNYNIAGPVTRPLGIEDVQHRQMES
jgi:hypothetical protein